MKFTRLDIRRYIDDIGLERRLMRHLYKIHKGDEGNVVYRRVNGDLRALRVFDTDTVRKALRDNPIKHTKLLLALIDNIEGDSNVR